MEYKSRLQHSLYDLLNQIKLDFSSDYTSKSSPANDTLHLDSQILPAPLAAYSYKTRVSLRQRAVLNTLLAAAGIGALLQPSLMAAALSWALFTAFSLLILMRALLCLAGICVRALFRSVPVTPDPDDPLPTFTIMVAVYEEADMMNQLAAALDAIRWSADKLEVFILLEADDPETWQAAGAARFPAMTQLILVPPGGPKTKANALNHGLTLARGQFLTIYDAEDRPHPDQLRHAYEAFRKAPENTVCIQAPLVATNGRSSWIAAQWALEYDVQFGLLIPGLALYRMPILLGGTSNHMRRDALLALGGWDAWNVTEDADLGMRMARAGLGTAAIMTPTYEIAPTRFGIWQAQRSRWLKGFLQTWLVLMRDPVRTWRQMGGIRFLVMQLTLGGAILTPLAHAPFAGLVGVAFWSGHLEVGLAGLVLLVAGLSVGLLADLLAPGKWSRMRLLAILTRPFYWPLHSLAAYRALWELANKPFFWAKTPHHPDDAERGPFYSTGSLA